MLLFYDRSRKERDPWLDWKVRLFLGGALVAVVGMAIEERWLITIAIGILVVGFLLRFIPHPASEEQEDEEASRSGSGS